MEMNARLFHQLACVAIGELSDKGYLLDPLDWDVKGQKYTVRIRGADRTPMVAVGLIMASLKSGKFVVYDAVTGEKDEFKLPEQKDTEAFLRFICAWAQKLREAATYK